MFGRKKNRYFYVVATGWVNNQYSTASTIINTYNGKFINRKQTENNLKETCNMTNPIITFFKEISESDRNHYVAVIK